MYVDFVRDFMLVGHRRRDYKEVYYRPDLTNDPDEDGTTPIMLYSSNKANATPQAPMEGEVMWFACFDVANCESRYKKERERLQMQTLYRAWEYLSTTDAYDVKELEDKYDDRMFLRWQAFFRMAKKWKRQRLRRRERDRKRCAAAAPGGTIVEPPQDLSILADLTDDSGFESDEEEQERSYARSGAKRTRDAASPLFMSDQTSMGAGRQASDGQHKRRARDSPFMSGGLGERGNRNQFRSESSASPFPRPFQGYHHGRLSAGLLNDRPLPPPKTRPSKGKQRQVKGRPTGKASKKAPQPTSGDDDDDDDDDNDDNDNDDENGDDDDDDDGERLAVHHNGIADEDEAYNRAVRASMQPDEQRTNRTVHQQPSAEDADNDSDEAETA